MKAQLIQALNRVGRCWLKQDYPLRQQAVALAAPEFCLSKPGFELVLDWIFSQWTEERFATLVEQNPFKESHCAVQVLASNTPAMIAQGLLQGAILSIPQWVKIPCQQTIFAQLLHQSFIENEVALPAVFELKTWQNKLLEFYSLLGQVDLVLAYGRDETIQELKKHLAPGALYRAHGHVESAAIIFKEAADRAYLEELAYDMLSYDQRGCLSPVVAFVQQGGLYSPAECAEIFAEEVLPPLAKQLPRGGFFPGEAAEILHQRILWGFRGQVYRGEDWTVCFAEKQGWPEGGALSRFMPILPFTTHDALLELLYPVQARLLLLGCAGSKVNVELLKQALTARFCRIGEMQRQLLVF